MTIVLLLIANFLKSKLWILVVVHKTCIVMAVILAFSVYFTDPQLMQVWFGFFWVVSRCKILTIICWRPCFSFDTVHHVLSRDFGVTRKKFLKIFIAVMSLKSVSAQVIFRALSQMCEFWSGTRVELFCFASFSSAYFSVMVLSLLQSVQYFIITNVQIVAVLVYFSFF